MSHPLSLSTPPPLSSHSRTSTPAMSSVAFRHAAITSRILPFSSARLSLYHSSSISLKSLSSAPLISHLFLNPKLRSSPHALTRAYSPATAPKCLASDPEQLKLAREDIKELLKITFSHPILVRLGWHDAGTYNKKIEEWPQRGGANGSLRFEIELKHAANAGLVNALKLVQPIKGKYPGVSYADLFQVASATAVEVILM